MPPLVIPSEAQRSRGIPWSFVKASAQSCVKAETHHTHGKIVLQVADESPR